MSRSVETYREGLSEDVEETRPTYSQITMVYAFPKGTFGNVPYEPSRELLEKWKRERQEEKRILRKHWFDRLIGIPEAEILSRYEIRSR